MKFKVVKRLLKHAGRCDAVFKPLESLRSANQNLRAKSGPQPAFVNKLLLEHRNCSFFYVVSMVTFVL